METRELFHQENKIFIEELKDVGTYLAESSEKILAIIKQMEEHRNSVVDRNLPPPPEPQEVFEIEPEEEAVSIKQEGGKEEDKVKVKKHKHRPKIVKVEPRPVTGSSAEDKSTPNYESLGIKEKGNFCVNCARIHSTHYKTCVTM